MRSIKHLFHGWSPTVLVGKTYRPYTHPHCPQDGIIYPEITEYMFMCSRCGYTWRERLVGKEVDTTVNK